jgi:hypothetical protein
MNDMSLPSLARLRVDSDDGLVGTSNVCRVDGEIRDIPSLVPLGFSLLLGLEPFLDGVLVTSRKGSENKFPSVWMTGMNGKSGTFRDGVDDREHVGEVEMGLETESVEVKGEGDEIDISSSFSVSEDCSFNSVCTCQTSKLSRGDCATYH